MAELLDIDTEPKIAAQTPAPGTEPSGWMPLTDEMRESAPEHVKKLLDTTKWNTIEDIAKGYTELQKFTGVGKHLVIPEENDTEGWNKVWNQLGKPENPDGYDFTEIETAAKEAGIPLEAELISKWKQYCYDRNIIPSHAADAFQFQLDIISAMNEAANTAREETKAALIKKWGGEANYKSNVIEARTIADQLGIYQTLEANGIASNPDIIEMLINIKNKTAESVITPPTPPPSTKDPIQELEEIKKSDAFTKRFHPQHKAVMQRFMELNMIIANSGLAPKRPQGG